MQKTFCDRCGVETGRTHHNHTAELTTEKLGRPRVFDLCETCIDLILDFFHVVTNRKKEI